jgi:hypothetical protein
VAIGKRVEVCFVDLSDDFALPQFRLSAEAPEHTPWQAGSSPAAGGRPNAQP